MNPTLSVAHADKIVNFDEILMKYNDEKITPFTIY